MRQLAGCYLRQVSKSVLKLSVLPKPCCITHNCSNILNNTAGRPHRAAGNSCVQYGFSHVGPGQSILQHSRGIHAFAAKFQHLTLATPFTQAERPSNSSAMMAWSSSLSVRMTLLRIFSLEEPVAFERCSEGWRAIVGVQIESGSAQDLIGFSVSKFAPQGAAPDRFSLTAHPPTGVVKPGAKRRVQLIIWLDAKISAPPVGPLGAATILCMAVPEGTAKVVPAEVQLRPDACTALQLNLTTVRLTTVRLDSSHSQAAATGGEPWIAVVGVATGGDVREY